MWDLKPAGYPPGTTRKECDSSMVRNRLRHLVAIGVTLIGLAIAPGVALATPQQTQMLGISSTSTGDSSGKDQPGKQSVQRASSAGSKATVTSPQAAECPATLHCVYMPAAYASNSPTDPTNYGNYDTANRPHDITINSVVIHDAEGTCAAVVNAFQNPMFLVSSHYMVCADGTIIQFVRIKDVAWHAANWWFNMHGIGIEHEGHAALGSTEYTPAMYRASATLVRWLSAKLGIPRDRQHIMGHDNVPATSGARIPRMHVDPGPFWDWQGYMWLLGAPVLPSGGANSKLITVAPAWPLSQQPVTGCWPADLPSCTPIGTQATNFVYLRTAPSNTAPMVADPVLGQGTTELGNNAARAFYGQTFAVNAKQIAPDGIWYQVWYDGQLAWFRSPRTAPTGLPTRGKYLTPKPGLISIPVYGRPLPNQSEYPANFVPPAGSVPYPTPLPYTIGAGQRYSVVGGTVTTDHYFAWTYNSSLPYDHMVFSGSEQYIRIQYNGRQAFVKRSDVVLAT